MYRVKLHPKVAKQLKRIMRGDRTYAEKIADEILSLSKNPYPQGNVHLIENIYRIRVGNYRIVYAVFEKEVVIVVGKVVLRNEATYKGLDDLSKKMVATLLKFIDDE